MNLLKLKKLANARHFEELAEQWNDAVAAEDADLEELLRIVGQVARLDAARVADDLLTVLLAVRDASGGREARLVAARLASAHVPESAKLREELTELYPALHGDFDQVGALCRVLIAEAESLETGVARMDRFLELRPGAFLRDRRHLDPGQVESVDGEAPSLYVSFAGRHFTLELTDVDEVAVLPPDHFGSLLRYRPDELRGLATEDAEAFVMRVLKFSRDRTCTYKDLRKHHGELFGEDAWAGWWKKARPVLKTSGRLELSGASQPTFRLLKQERSYEDRLRGQFRLLKDPAERLEFALDYLDLTRKEREAEEALLVELGNAAARQAGPLLDSNSAMTLACLAVHAKVAERGAPVARPNPKAAVQVVKRIAEPGRLNGLLTDRLLVISLQYVRTTLPETWADVWSQVLPKAGKSISELIARELLAAGKAEVLGEALKAIHDAPTASSEVMCWFWRARYGSSRQAAALAALPGLDTGRSLNAMLELIDSVGRMAALSDDKGLRTELDQVHETLALYESLPVREYVEGLGRDAARILKSRIDGNDGVRAGLKATITAALRGNFPEIYIEAARPWEEEDVYYTTELGLQQRQNELEQLITVEIPAVAKQIGEAASHGDLSENAEYTAALEKRDQITSNATRIENELALAKVITPDMLDTEYVNVGTRVTLKNLDTGDTEVMAFMGVWDSNPDKGVLSYRAPLAMAFMGKRAGDTVSFGEGSDERRWEILELGSAV